MTEIHNKNTAGAAKLLGVVALSLASFGGIGGRDKLLAGDNASTDGTPSQVVDRTSPATKPVEAATKEGTGNKGQLGQEKPAATQQTLSKEDQKLIDEMFKNTRRIQSNIGGNQFIRDTKGDPNNPLGGETIDLINRKGNELVEKRFKSIEEGYSKLSEGGKQAFIKKMNETLEEKKLKAPSQGGAPSHRTPIYELEYDQQVKLNEALFDRLKLHPKKDAPAAK